MVSPVAAFNAQTLTHRTVLAIAVPIILSNVTTPLIGVVDTAVLGQLGPAYLIGAVAIGGTIFSFVYWSFGFLRMGTTGLTAQAEGADDVAETGAILWRGLLLAGCAGLLLIIFQKPIGNLSLYIFDGTARVEQSAETYYRIRIWSAPLALANYVFLGWFIGLGRAKTAFGLQILLNLTNAGLDGLFVLVFELGVPGVAWGTLIAESVAAFAGLGLAMKAIGNSGYAARFSQIMDRNKIKKMITINRDIMIRTVCLLFAFAFFTAQGAKGGDPILAANAVLLNFVSVSAYFLDGFAFAAETLVGRSIGARQLPRFVRVVLLSSLWAALIALAVSLVYWLAGNMIVDAITINANVRETAKSYLIWAIIMPTVGVACFQLDGIFIGATRTADMRNMMILSLMLYILVWKVSAPYLGNHGLWLALMSFFVIRALTLLARLPALIWEAFPDQKMML